MENGSNTKRDVPKEELELLNEIINYKTKIGECNKLLQLQLSNMSMGHMSDETNLYMGGMYNGMELLMSVLEDRSPMFCDLSTEQTEQESDEEKEQAEPQEAEQINKTISGRVK